MKKLDLSTQEGLKALKAKAKSYGHYAEFLQVVELIEIVEELRGPEEASKALEEQRKKLGW